MNYLTKPFIYLSYKLKRHQFIALLAILVGFSAGLTAVALKSITHFLQDNILLFTSNWFYYALFPAVGIILSVFVVQYFFKGEIEHGVESVKKDIAEKSSIAPASKVYSNFITSALTIGFGGSSGLEGPIVATGSAIGSNIVKPYQLDYKERTLMLASGAAAGIAAVFNAPVTGMIFAIEILLANVAISNLIPLMLASVAGALCSKILLHESILFKFEQNQFDYTNIPYYIILALLTSVVSLYYTRVSHSVKIFFQRYKGRPYIKSIIGGTLLIVLCLLLPPLFGEGYNSIAALSSGHPEKLLENSILTSFISGDNWLLVFVFMAMLLKAFATAITIQSGGNGGNFAPSLFVGGLLGYSFSTFINRIGLAIIPVSNFTLVSMAGILSGVMLAPLTAIFLIAEVTHGYDLIIPLMLVSSVSFFFVRTLDRYSKDGTPSIFNDDESNTKEYNTKLSSLSIEKILENNITMIHKETSLRELIHIIKTNKNNAFPVVDNKNKLEGIIYLNDIKNSIFDQTLYDKITVIDLMQTPTFVININDHLDTVINLFDKQNHWSLPVTDNNGIYIGFISHTGILSEYRKLIDDRKN